MVKNLITVYVNNDGSILQFANDPLVGASSVTNRIYLVSEWTVDDNKMIELVVRQMDGSPAPEVEMLFKQQEVVNGSNWNVYYHDLTGTEINYIFGQNNPDGKVALQFRWLETYVTGGVTYQEIRNSVVIDVDVDGAIEFELPDYDPSDLTGVYQSLSSLSTSKLDADFSILADPVAVDGTEYVAIYKGTANNKITVETFKDYILQPLTELGDNIGNLLEWVDQDVSSGANPYFTNPEVEGLELRNPENPAVVETLEYGDVKKIDDANAHIGLTADNPHGTVASQIEIDNSSYVDGERLYGITDPTLQDVADKVNVHNHEIDEVNGLTNALNNKSNVGHTHAEYLTEETVTSLAINGNVLSYTDETGQATEIDLSVYVDDTNLSRIISATYDAQTKLITFTRDDASFFTMDASVFFDDTNLVTSVAGKSGAVTLADEDIAVDASGFTGVLNTDDNTVEKALTTIDSHGHTESDITDLDKYTQGETDALLSSKVDVGTLSSSITLYPTTTESDIAGYFRMVTSVSDDDYDTVAVDVPTGAITGTNQLIASLVADPALFIGNPSVVNLNTIGNIRKTAGNSTDYAQFYYEIYHRTEAGVETLVTTSSNTEAVAPDNLNVYEEFFAGALLNNGEWSATDRLVIKYYGSLVSGNDPEYDFQFGGQNPVRTLLPIPLNVVNNAYYINYDDTTTGYGATNVQEALEGVNTLIQQNTSVIKIQRYVITNTNNGDGTFTYQRNGDGTDILGTLDGSEYQFVLQDGVEYIVGANRTEIKINNDTAFYPNDTEVTEIDGTTIGITYSFNTSDEIFFKVYQGLDSVVIEVADGSVTTTKLSAGLQSDLSDYSDHLTNKQNPHEVVGSQVNLDRTNFTDLLMWEGSDLTVQQAMEILDSHGHPISDITNLQNSLDGKAPTVHTHTIANVTGLQDELNEVDKLTQLTVLTDNTGGQFYTTFAHTLADGQIYLLEVPDNVETADANISFDGGTTYYSVKDADGNNLTASDIIGKSFYIVYPSSSKAYQVAVGGGGVAVIASDTAPEDTNSLWFNTFDGGLYYYYDDGSSQQWVSVAVDTEVTLEQISGTENLANIHRYSCTLLTTATWTDQTGYFTTTVTVSGILDEDIHIALDLTSVTDRTIKTTMQEEFAQITDIYTSTDTVTFETIDSPTFTYDMPFKIEVIR